MRNRKVVSMTAKHGQSTDYRNIELDDLFKYVYKLVNAALPFARRTVNKQTQFVNVEVSSLMEALLFEFFKIS